MKYMGSKNRIAKHILPIMLVEAEKNGITKWVEPFVGGANMIDKVPDTFAREGYDINRYLIALLNYSKQGGHISFDQSKQHYDDVRQCFNKGIDKYPDYYIGLVGFMASANGRFFDGGYSGKSVTQTGAVRDYIAESIKGFSQQIPKLNDINLYCDDYRNLLFDNSLIYCDPPYYNSKGYNKQCFNHEQFFQWCRDMRAKGNVIFVSEYEAPDDFECVWQMEVASSLSANGKQGGNKKSIEKLFKLP